MTQDACLEFPKHAVAKIGQVLGIPPSELAQRGQAKLIEDLCDKDLMFDR